MDSNEVHRCGEDIVTHAAKIMVGTRIAGVGMGCMTAYEALIELAYAVKVTNNLPDYTPTGIVLQKVKENETMPQIPLGKMGQA